MTAPAGGNGGCGGRIPVGAVPSVRLAVLLERAAGPGRRHQGLGDDDLMTAAGRWAAMESGCASRKLAVICEVIRRNPAAGHEAGVAGGLPGCWRETLAEEVALELGIARRTAAGMIELAWVLARRLPLTAAALDDGVLSPYKAQIVADGTAVLDDAAAGEAEALIAGEWDGWTPDQLRRKVARAVVEADPEGAKARREEAEQENARYRFWREHAGTAGLMGSGLPADEALRAHGNIQHRALQYRAHGVTGSLELLRVMAMLDLINGTDARDTCPKTARTATLDDAAADGAGSTDDAGRSNGTGIGGRDDNGQDSDGQDDQSQDDHSQDDGGKGGPGGSGGTSPRGGPGTGLAASTNLTVPLVTLLGLAERAGEAHGLGVLDASLARRLVTDAAANPASTFEVTVTDSAGHAIGYGRASPARVSTTRSSRPPGPGQIPLEGTVPPQGTAGPAPPPSFTAAGPGPPGSWGTWALRIGDLHLTVTLIPMPGGDCDHRAGTGGYRPGVSLRRMVQIRDGECTLPICSRHPKGCEFDHTIPWPTGRTCACNGATRCSHDHHVKHSPGWSVTQLPDGRQQWTTPSGKTYTSERYKYPI
jgi:Domain of unknown function (DUF222)